MLIHTVEYDTRNALLSLVEEINSQQAAAWGLVAIKREYLRELPNKELVLAMKPALEEVSRTKIFFMEKETIYVSWFGMPRQTYQKIMLACQSLMRPGETEPVETIATYLDPQVMGNELHIHLHSGANKGAAEPGSGRSPGNGSLESTEFFVTAAQIEQFKKQVERRPGRQQLNILIVEDQCFLRNLLSEVLRAAYEINVAQNVREGWDNYLERAPDIIFLDIGLPDGSGHSLAKKIKEFDPSSYVVMVTVSNQLNDVEMAKQNHVDGFIIKPFNKKKIAECIDHYTASRNMMSKKRNLI